MARFKARTSSGQNAKQTQSSKKMDALRQEYNIHAVVKGNTPTNEKSSRVSCDTAADKVTTRRRSSRTASASKSPTSFKSPNNSSHRKDLSVGTRSGTRGLTHMKVLPNSPDQSSIGAPKRGSAHKSRSKGELLDIFEDEDDDLAAPLNDRSRPPKQGTGGVAFSYTPQDKSPGSRAGTQGVSPKEVPMRKRLLSEAGEQLAEIRAGKSRRITALPCGKETAKDHSNHESNRSTPKGNKTSVPDSTMQEYRRSAAARRVHIPTEDHSVGENLSLGIDSLGVERLLTKINSAIREQLREMKDVQSKGLRSLEHKFSADMRSFREEIVDLVSSAGSYSKIAHSGKDKGSKQNQWEQQLEEQTPFKALAFSSASLATVLSFNVSSTVSDLCNTALMENALRTKASDAISALLFSLRPNEPKENNKSGIGLLHCNFRFEAVCNAFFNVQKNTFGAFSHDQCGNSIDKPIGERSVEMPRWLQPRYVDVAILGSAREAIEVKHQAKKSKVKDIPTRVDIATHGAVKVFRMMISHLHTGREKVRTMFFQELGYLMMDWSPFEFHLDQKHVSLSWQVEDDNVLSFLSIPDSVTCRIGSCTREADVANQELMQKVMTSTRNLVLSARHEVFVVAGSGSKAKQRKHSGGVKKPITRSINLLEIASYFCTEFTQLDSTTDFLRSNPSALRCLYANAVVFKALVCDFLRKSDFEGYIFPALEDVSVGSLNLAMLFPGKVSRLSSMQSRCIRLTSSEYEERNQPQYGVNTNSSGFRSEETIQKDAGIEIEASLREGIAQL